MTPTTSRTRRRGTAAVMRALLSLVAVLVLVGGLPVLLWHATTAAWTPGIDALGQLLSSADTVPVFLLALTVLGWAGWAAFTLSLVLEVPAQLRGMRAPRLPGLGAGQRAAATLVGGILLLLPAGTALASPAQATTTVSAPHNATTPAPSTLKNPSAEASSPAGQEAPTYTVRDVRPAESLWSIAEDHLGDGSRYTEIADLNEGRTMSDGRIFRTDAPIQPGWTLRMPAPPKTPAVPAPHPQGTSGKTATSSYTVKAGDTLTAIAEDELDDADKYTDIYTANKKTLADPDHIYTGQHLTLPTTPEPTDTTPNPTPAPERPVPAPDPSRGNEGSEEQKTPEKTPEAKPAPTTPAPSTTPASPAHTPSAPSPSDREPEAPVPPAKTTPAPSPSSSSSSPAVPGQSPSETPPAAASSLDLQTVAGTGALLAGSVVSALALRRLLQRRRRKPGQTTPTAETGHAEQFLGAVAAQASPQLLDHALRALAHRAQAEGHDVPVLRAASVTARTVSVLPDDLSAAPAWPFTKNGEEDGGWWQLPASRELPEETREARPPLPGLVTVGSRPDSSLLLLNLPAVRHLLLDGTRENVEQVALSLALELSQSPWATTAEIVTVGFGKELCQLLPAGQIMCVDTLAQATRDLAERAIENHLDAEEHDGEEPLPQRPWILLAPGLVEDEEVWALADALDKAQGVPACVVLPAAVRSHFPDADILNAGLDDSTLQTLPCIDDQVRLQHMDPDVYAEVLHALTAGLQPPQGPEEPWTNVPQEPVPLTPQAHARRAAQHQTPRPVSLLGPGLEEESPSAPASSGAFHALLAAVHTTTTATGAAAVPAQASPTPPAPATTDPAPAGEKNPVPPMLRVLGDIEVTGISDRGHGPKLARLTALLHLRPNRDTLSIREAMDPMSPWSAETLHTRCYDLRTRLGQAPDDTPYLPRRTKGGTYTLHPDLSCDWHAFLRLAQRGLTTKTVEPLDEALALVRGRPFGTNAPTWAIGLRQDMIIRIIDVAHTSAYLHTHAQDWDNARHAITVGLDVDESAELLYRDLLRLDDACNNRTGIHTTVETIRRINEELDVSMEPETEHLITQLLAPDTATSSA
ncbi:LysM peptidoglycan-binding domain-containing protein [Streptomyces sp. NPDC087440]|uniref:LysM peptidoglycan-binding domain-containing protein n=1 Tax=Streptomyces sp. NPDC087440 TaxID=3365790 RepID=UPI0037F96480